MTMVAESFKQYYGIDPREDPAGFNRLYEAAVEAKHALSARSRATIRVDFGGQAGEIQISREQFEEITSDLLERTAYTSRQLAATAGLDWAQVNRVLLVGGSTRMPMVRRMLMDMTRLDPDRTVNPDEAVARGAAIYANHLLAQRGESAIESSFTVTNVNAHSLGVEGIDPDTYRKINVVLIPRNTPLPARFTERFVTKTAGQQSIVVQVLEGESTMPGDCTAIGRTVIRNLPLDLPANWPVEVTFEYGENGRLNVVAVVPGTHGETSLQIERRVGLSDEGVSTWKQAVDAASGFDAFGAVLADPAQLHRVDLGGQPAPAIGHAAAPAPEQQATAASRHAASSQWAAVPNPISAQGEGAAQPPRMSVYHPGMVAREAAAAGTLPQPIPMPGAVLAPPGTLPGGPVPVPYPPQAVPAAPLPAPLPYPPAGQGYGSPVPMAPQSSPASPASPLQAVQAPANAGGGIKSLQIAETTSKGRNPPFWLRWTIRIVGLAVSGVVGLAIGYAIVRIFLPNVHLPGLW
jgi:hypothetical protein